jgi:hypothetical protein
MIQEVFGIFHFSPQIRNKLYILGYHPWILFKSPARAEASAENKPNKNSNDIFNQAMNYPLG